MNIRTFTPQDFPDIIAIHNSLHIVWPELPQEPETWVQNDLRRDPRVKYQRWLAFEGDQPVGFASFGQNLEDVEPHRFQINVKVRPEFQRRGIGSALYDHLLADLQQFEPRILRADTFTNLPQGFSFAQERGFYEAFRETPVHLDLATFDPAPYASLEPQLKTQGITIKTCAELASDPERDRKLYELYNEVEEDLPHEVEYTFHKPAFADWVKYSLKDPANLHDAYFVAVRGTEYVGLRELAVYPGGNALLGGFLAVRRTERNRGIGLAMQLRGIAYGRQHGYPLLRTCTGVMNTPMQNLFNKLGYARDPEWLQCQKNMN
jgi:mycothiol synthase